MQLTVLDWSIVALTLTLTLTIGFGVSKRSSRSSASFFLAGRNMPWWLLGLSMVATTFSADTPNLVTNIVRTNGISGNWIWWSMLITGMLTSFVYARLWRRLAVTTDVEFYERRYSGGPARFLRGFRAIYLGLFFNIMIMASVTLAAIKIGTVLFSVSPLAVVTIAGLVTVSFSAAGGFLGVLITDMLLFVLAMTGSICAAYYAVNHPDIGGLDALLSNTQVVGKLSVLPDFSNPDQYVPILLVPLLVQWWSVWYPGAEPGGGGYIAQRMLAAKNEKHAVAASAFFNFCHYAVRPWPWILVALASLVVFPDLNSLAAALPQVPANIIADDLAYSAMLTFLPPGIMGIVVASLVSAYISTISTSLNWGASYVVNDFYARFINPDASGRQQVTVGRMVTALLMVLAGVLALKLESAMQAFRLLLSIGAGTGLLFLLRWFWSRINAWSEIAAMLLSFIVSLYFEFGPFVDLLAWEKMVLSVGFTTVGWVVVTLVTPPEEKTTLDRFNADLALGKGEVKRGMILTLFATLGIYAALFAVGSMIYGNSVAALALGFVALVLLMICYRRSVAVME